MYRMNFSALIKIRGPVTYNFHEIIHYKRLFELQTLVSCLLHKRLSNGGIVKYEFNLPQNCSQKAGAFQKLLCASRSRMNTYRSATIGFLKPGKEINRYSQ